MNEVSIYWNGKTERADLCVSDREGQWSTEIQFRNEVSSRQPSEDGKEVFGH